MTSSLLQRRREQMFPKLTAGQLERLRSYGECRDTHHGEILVEIGDRPRGLFVVLTGSIEILVDRPRTRDRSASEEVLYVLEAADFTGEMSTLRGSAGFARIRVRDAGRVIVVDPDKLRMIMQTDAELSEIFMRAFILRRMDLLETAQYEVVVLGSSHSADTLRLQEFLSRNARPYLYVDMESDADAQTWLERFPAQPGELPVVICNGNELFRNPSNRQLAESLGLNPVVDDDAVHDLLIVGAGPAGLAAAVYAASEGLDVRLVESFAAGGQAGTSSRIENYLGFPTGISGRALAGRALSQAQKFGAHLTVAWTAARLECQHWPYRVEMDDGRIVRARSILIACGVRYRSLRLENVERFLGTGIYFAATHIEAMLCKDEEIVVVGGGNSAGQAAVFLAGTCRHVHILVRGDGLADSMSRYLAWRIEETPNITLHTRTELTELTGSDRVGQVTWTRGPGRSAEQHEIKHVFLMTGAEPNTAWLAGCVELDDHGFVKTGTQLQAEDLASGAWPLPRRPYLLETSAPGVFAAGDARAGSTKRIASAVGEGSSCVQFVHQCLKERADADPRQDLAMH